MDLSRRRYTLHRNVTTLIGSELPNRKVAAVSFIFNGDIEINPLSTTQFFGELTRIHPSNDTYTLWQ